VENTKLNKKSVKMTDLSEFRNDLINSVLTSTCIIANQDSLSRLCLKLWTRGEPNPGDSDVNTELEPFQAHSISIIS
jgi:hypothetical protein